MNGRFGRPFATFTDAGVGRPAPARRGAQSLSSSFVCHWRKPIDLCRHDEIVLVETLDLLGAQRHGPIAPAEADVGMVTFRLRKLANLLNECQRLPEVPETKGLFDPVRIIHERPFRSLWEEFFGFRSCQRRDAAAARGASFLDERFR